MNNGLTCKECKSFIYEVTSLTLDDKQEVPLSVSIPTNKGDKSYAFFECNHCGLVEMRRIIAED